MKTARGRTLGWLVTFAAVPALAAAGASGTFSKDAATFKVADAFAYEGKAEFGDETAIKVRLSAKPLDHKALEGVIDFKAELERQLAQSGNVTDEGFWEVALYDRHSLKLPTLKVTGGRTKGDWAELLVEGSGPDGKRKGSVFLRRGPAGWRPDHERLSSE